MSGLSKVIVLDPDPRAGRQVQLGFEREGLPTLVPEISSEAATIELGELDGVDPALVVVGGRNGQAVDLVRRARNLLDSKGADVPIVCTGRGASRRELAAAGADEVVEPPVYLRDVVTIGRLLSGVPSGQRDHLVGSLVETTGMLTLVRALSALGRSAVLTLIRGLRRGEIRFFQGEVTSASVSLIHGQAALHQLLLWTDARFDYAHEDIVRRQQIPLSRDELFADAEHFLEGVREHAGDLSPASVLEQNIQRVHDLGKQIPTEVHGVLRMFDGHRMLVDILEDSPYRVFETLRVAQRAVEAGLLKQVEAARPKATWRAVLAIEEWLVGSDTRDAVLERTAALDSGPTSVPRKTKGTRRSKKVEAVTPRDPKAEIDWGALVPRVIGAEVGPLAGVVPAQEAHGEVDLPTRDKPREGLETLDTDKRQRIFPTDIGLEPKVVVSSGDTAEWERVELEAKQKLVDEEVAPQAAAPEVAPPEVAPPEVAPPEASPPQAAPPQAAPPEASPEVAPPEAVPEAAAAPEQGGPDEDSSGVEAKGGRRKQKNPTQEAFAAKATAIAPELVDTAKSEPTRSEPAQEQREPLDAASAALIAVPTTIAPSKSDPVAAVTAAPDTASEPRPPRPSGTDASALVRELVAAVLPPKTTATTDAPPTGPGATSSESAAAPIDQPLPSIPAPPSHGAEPRFLTDLPANVAEPTVDVVSQATTKPVVRFDEHAITTPMVRVAEPITVAEAPATSVAIADVVTVSASADTAVVTATPRVMIREHEGAAKNDAAPTATDDDPSDGVVRSMIATADTARLTQGRLRQNTPEHDGPAIKETTGEIRERPQAKAREPAVVEETSIVIADLAAVHAAATAAAEHLPAAPPADAASPSRELAVSDVRRDAVKLETAELSAAEEAFFKKADQTAPAVKLETFNDLDEGYEPPRFWDRVFGRRPKKKP